MSRRKPRPTRVYREEMVFAADGRASVRQTFDKRRYDQWRALYANGLPPHILSLTYVEAEITWAPEEILVPPPAAASGGC